MNKLKVGAILLFALWMHIGYAQQSNETPCQEKTAITLEVIKYANQLPAKDVQEIIDYLSSCVEAGDIEASYITGALTLYATGSQLTKERRTIELLEKAIDGNYEPAVLKLATLYITGVFKRLNRGVQGKAARLFEKMIALN